MDKAIEIVENRLKNLEQYKNIESFNSRIMILKDVLKDLKDELRKGK